MSVFSIIKRGRAQAKEHNAKQADREKAEAVQAQLPYRHVPTHAATDALATAPSSWKQDDRSRIKEQNQRRSAMVASSSNHPLPRIGSSLAHVSYPSVYANPVVSLPKNHSYVSVSSSWRDKMANTPEASEEEDYYSNHKDYKGKGKEVMPGGRASPMLSSGRTSPLSNRAVPVGVGVAVAAELATSSGSQNANGSENEKEKRPRVAGNNSHDPEPKPPSSRGSSTTGERLHHLHPSHARNMSDSRNKPDRYYPPHAKSSYFEAPRPPIRRNHSLDITTTPTPVAQVQFYDNQASSSIASSASSIGIAISTAPTSAASTPPSSTRGDTSPAEKQSTPSPTPRAIPPGIHPRRLSLSEFMRASSDTVRPSTASPERSNSRAPSIRERRLSKTKTQEPGEVQTVTINPNPHPLRVAVNAVQFTMLSREKSNSIVAEVDQLATPSPGTKEKHTKRHRLSKDRNGHVENAKISPRHGWSFFSRRSSPKSA